MARQTIRPRGIVSHATYGSDVIVDLLRAFDIPYVTCSTGSSFKWIHDSIVNYGMNARPEMIMCAHEEVSVALAHGYAKAAGRPLAALVHDLVGLQHASMAVYNAWCDRAPVLVLGGVGPMDATGRREWDWMHTALVQGTQVRDYVKWDDQPYNLASVPESFVRGYRLATAEPQGPVYLCYDAAVQMEGVEDTFVLPDPSRYAPASPLQADADALEQLARWLVEADYPVIVADFMGRDPRAVPALQELAELLSIPVVDRLNRFNFPSGHPLDLTGAEQEAVGEADVVLLLEHKTPYTTLYRRDRMTRQFSRVAREDARIASIGLWELRVRSWATEYQRLTESGLNIVADTTVALPQLVQACRRMLKQKGSQDSRLRQRWDYVKGQHDALRSGWRKALEDTWGVTPISLPRVSHEVKELLKDEDWVVAHWEHQGTLRRYMDWTKPYQFVGFTGGGGIGYAIGASLGVALAHRDAGRVCVDFQPDGDLLYAPSALWTAAHHRIPLLMIMFNNRSYYNSEDHAVEVAQARERPVERRGIGIRFEDPCVDFAGLARSFGVYGEGPVESPDDLAPALRRALRVVKEDRLPALVDVVTQPR